MITQEEENTREQREDRAQKACKAGKRIERTNKLVRADGNVNETVSNEEKDNVAGSWKDRLSVKREER